MINKIRSILVDFTGVVIIGIVIYFIAVGNVFQTNEKLSIGVSDSFLNLNTIFLSILIEAIPFVLIGVLIAGVIQIFVTEEHIRKCIPKNKFLAVTMSCVVGAFFPACECGIVPIVRRLVAKGVPIYAGIGFLLTGPLINPIVILSTFMAFGNDLKIASYRMIAGFIIALVIALIISLLYKSNQLKEEAAATVEVNYNQTVKMPFSGKLMSMFKHSIDEFFDMGKYLIIGAFLAAFVQTYVSSASLLEIGGGVVSSTLVMMGLAYVLSLCSEADAFIGASFRNVFPSASILGFLIYGPMIDLKNSFMLFSVFKSRFVFQLILIITVTVFIGVLLLHGIY